MTLCWSRRKKAVAVDYQEMEWVLAEPDPECRRCRADNRWYLQRCEADETPGTWVMAKGMRQRRWRPMSYMNDE